MTTWISAFPEILNVPVKFDRSSFDSIKSDASNADFTKKVTFPIAKSGDLMPLFHFGWRILSKEESFKRYCWEMVELCNRYQREVSFYADFSAKKFEIQIYSKNPSRHGFQDKITINSTIKDDCITIIRECGRHGRTKKIARKRKMPLWVFCYRLEKCLKRWSLNSQFQFDMVY